MEDLGIWNEGIEPKAYAATDEKYLAAVMEQYKLYVDLTDRFQSRGPAVDSFFLTINTAAFALIAAAGFRGLDLSVATMWLAVPLAALLVNCYVWWRTIRSRRFITGAKFQVIGALESRLPSSPFFIAEWKALDRAYMGRFAGPVQEWIPIAFGFVYVGMFAAALAA